MSVRKGSKKKAAGETGELEVLFPNKVVTLADSTKVTVSPLSLEDLPKVIKTFATIMGKADVGIPHQELAILAMEDFVELMPHCIDREPREVPFSDVPEIIDIIVRQNVTDESVGKWMALARRLMAMLPEDAVPSSQ